MRLRIQGNDEPSILQLSDKSEHKRVRKHMSAFFTQENIEKVVITLRNGLTAKAAERAGVRQGVRRGRRRILRDGDDQQRRDGGARCCL